MTRAHAPGTFPGGVAGWGLWSLCSGPFPSRTAVVLWSGLRPGCTADPEAGGPSSSADHLCGDGGAAGTSGVFYCSSRRMEGKTPLCRPSPSSARVMHQLLCQKRHGALRDVPVPWPPHGSPVILRQQRAVGRRAAMGSPSLGTDAVRTRRGPETAQGQKSLLSTGQLLGHS